jgi:hypothetical protein
MRNLPNAKNRQNLKIAYIGQLQARDIHGVLSDQPD